MGGEAQPRNVSVEPPKFGRYYAAYKEAQARTDVRVQIVQEVVLQIFGYPQPT